MTALPLEERLPARATLVVARAAALVAVVVAGIGVEAWLVSSRLAGGILALAPVGLVLAGTAPAVAGLAVRLAARVHVRTQAGTALVRAGARTSGRVLREELLVPAALAGVATEASLVVAAPEAALPALAPIGLGLAWTARQLVRGGARRAIRSGQCALLGIAVAYLLAVGVVPHLGFYRTLTALSNSMQPTFAAGDMLVVRPEPLADVRAGQVLALQLPNGGRTETHRVVRVVRAGAHPVVETAGDATKVRDPWGRIRLTGTTAWRVVLVVPRAGYVIHAFRTPLVHLLGLYVAPALLALLTLLEVWDVPARLRRLRRPPVALRPAPGAARSR